eukprot:gene9654-biopygen5823
MSEIFVFDAYGTLFDVHSAVAAFREEIGPQADRLSELWRSKQLEYTWVRTLAGQYQPFDRLTAQALDSVAARCGGLSDALKAKLLGAYQALTAYDDVLPALQRLRARGSKTAIFSNGTPAQLDIAVKAARLDGLFDAIISIDAIGIYKTDPRAYALVTAQFNCTPQEIIFQSSNRLRAQVAQWRNSGEKVALVPTMGALHQGHLALMRQVQAMGCKVVTSIFVNPTQFAPTEDLSNYPRPFTADMAKLTALGVDALFYPDVSAMYGAGFCTTISLEGPANVGLEDRFRPGHFAGVATVVAKLLLQALPDIAIFGEKDFQQLAVIRQMVLDLNIPVEILGGATIREPDGLALSSRNVYLSLEERRLAPEIHHALKWCAAHFGKEPMANVLNAARIRLEGFGFVPDYLELRDAVSLAPVTGILAPCRLLFAGRIGKTRLIDNIAVLP